MDSKQQNHPGLVSLICLALFVITLAAFWPVGRQGFIIYDDRDYVSENQHVQTGLTADSVRWAFTSRDCGNWHPITWLSHMLDCRLFGLKAAGHHWVNLGFHIANTLLLFIVLREMMGLRSDKSIGATTPQVGLRRDGPQQPYDSPPRNANKTANAAMAATTPQAQTVWRSALVAALFALHPTHLQSVAWISERKDVLSAFFFLLTLWAYTRYAQKQSRVEPSSLRFAAPRGRGPSAGDDGLALDPRRWTLDYFLALMFFALGLMSKPMLVTLPVILLLLDFWPLGRVAGGKWRVTRFGVQVPQLTGAMKQSEGGSTPWRAEAERRWLNHLLFEKLPFVALSLASSLATFWAQQAAEYVVSANLLPWYWRIANSLVFYTDYLGKMFWPVNLAIFYPYTPIHLWEFICSALLPVLLSFFCLRRARSQSYLLVGWFWFVVMLVPVIGLVQVGMQTIADRYTYLPSIGLFIAVAWGMAGVASVSRFWRAAMVAGATALVLACLLDTRYQLRYWRDSVTLFTHVVEVTRENNFEGYYLLGNSYGEAGDWAAAAKSYQSALQISPNLTEACSKLGRVLFLQKKYDEAGALLDGILQLHPDNAEAREFYGDTLAAQGKYAEAEAEYTAALQLKPDDAVIRTALAFAAQQVENEENRTNLNNGLMDQLPPEVHVQIAVMQAKQGKFQNAVGHYLEALRLKPDAPEVLNNLAWLLATCPDAPVRDGAQAVKYAERACKLTHYKQTIMVGTLAAAYAEAGRFDEAISMAEKACTLAAAAGEQGLLQKNQELLALYQKHQPYHEAP
jgi:tetratricopeptide (TPR) repeat protein